MVSPNLLGNQWLLQGIVGRRGRLGYRMPDDRPGASGQPKLWAWLRKWLIRHRNKLCSALPLAMNT